MNSKKFYDSASAYFVSLHSVETLTANRIIKFPDESGTLLTSGASGSRYVAALTQSGTAAPTATIFTPSSNSLYSIVWTRSGLGVYVGTLSGAFKTDGSTDVWMRDMTDVVSVVVTDVNTITITTNADSVLSSRRIEINVL